MITNKLKHSYMEIEKKRFSSPRTWQPIMFGCFIFITELIRERHHLDWKLVLACIAAAIISGFVYLGVMWFVRFVIGKVAKP
jgi:hypothetical protein